MRTHKLSLALLISVFFLTSCNGGFSDLKRSSNNKLIDTKGFHKSKRRPLYNSKYINQAKKNIISNDIDSDTLDDEDQEFVTPASKNLKMYSKMARSKNSANMRMPDEYDDEDFENDNLIDSRNKIAARHNNNEKADLEREIVQIKKMLEATKDEIAKAKCPYTSSKKGREKRYIDDEEPMMKQPRSHIKQGAMTSVIKD